jgi:hypothetical protein
MSHTRLFTLAFLLTATFATTGCGIFRRGYVVYAPPPPEPALVIAEPEPPAPKPAPKRAEPATRTIVVHAPPGSTVIVNPNGSPQVVQVPGEAPQPPAPTQPANGGWADD